MALYEKIFKVTIKCFIGCISMREQLSLNGKDWLLHQFRPGEGVEEGVYQPDFWAMIWNWVRASVPGDVHSAIIDENVIPNPYWGRNNEKIKWVVDYEWWYRKWFSVPENWRGKVVRLVFHGVDFKADFWLNGKHIGAHEGMFSPIVFDITNVVNYGESEKNLIAVCIHPPPKDRSKTGGRKCNLGYSIDYVPELITMGIWEDAEIVATGKVYIEDLYVTSKIGENVAHLTNEISIYNTSTDRKKVTLKNSVTGENFVSKTSDKSVEFEVPPGSQSLAIYLEVPEPRLWWPWDMGEQNLYKTSVEVLEEGKSLDNVMRVFGIREVRIIPNKGAPEDSAPWTFCINGKRNFVKGANWTNIDLLYGRFSRERYEKLLTLAKEANMNILRIHGWHIREKEEFYNICNRLGILVWQEFAFANLNYPQTPDFLEKVAVECGEVVKTLRNHPSLIAWCGGNEYSYVKNLKLIKTLEKVCKKVDPSRPFISVSGPPEQDETRLKFDFHNWQVWHRFKPIEFYSEDKESLFISEFGLQSVPCVESLKEFIPPEELWPAGPSWKYHFIEMEKMRHYVQQITHTDPSTLKDFVEATQKAQAETLKYGIEYFRRMKYRISGCMFWQFNEPWPSICWSVVDWFLRPKLAYYTVKDAYAPVLVCAEYPKKSWSKGETFKCKVWVINDLHKTLGKCFAEFRIIDNRGKTLMETSMNTDIHDDSALPIGQIESMIPEDLVDSFMLDAKLTDYNGIVISQNRYSFNVA